MNCPKCGKPVQANARYCGSCGTGIDSGAGQSPASAVPTADAATAAGAIPAAGTGASTAGPRSWSASASSMPGLIERIKNVILSPKSEWPVIAPEPTTVAQLYTGYVMPLAGLAAVMALVRMSIIGVHIPFGGSIRTPITSGVLYALFTFGAGLVGLFLVGWIINALAGTFAGQRDQRQALKVAAYAFTPAWLGSVLALSPILSTLLQLIAGLYGIYLLYLGLPILMRSPKDRALGYTASVVIGTIVLGILFGILSALAGHFGAGGVMGSNSPAAQAAARDQGAAAAGNAIGSVLGTDAQGKAGLAAALSNLAKAGEQSGQAADAGGSRAAAAAGGTQMPAGAAPSAGSSSPGASGGGDAVQSPASAVGGLLTAFGGALGGPHRVATVDFKTLTGLLPTSLPGMTRTEAQGENQGAIGIKTSSAHADYVGDAGARLHIEISDLSGVSGLMDAAGALIQNTTSESDSGYEKDQIIGGRSVHEKYDAKAKKAELSVMLAKRFQVSVNGDGVDMHTLEQALGQVNLAQLEAMKDQGATPP